MRKNLVMGIGVAIIIVAVGVAGAIFTDSINFEDMIDNDQDNSMQMSDSIELSITTPDEEKKPTNKQVDAGLTGTGDE